MRRERQHGRRRKRGGGFDDLLGRAPAHEPDEQCRDEWPARGNLVNRGSGIGGKPRAERELVDALAAERELRGADGDAAFAFHDLRERGRQRRARADRERSGIRQTGDELAEQVDAGGRGELRRDVA